MKTHVIRTTVRSIHRCAVHALRAPLHRRFVAETDSNYVGYSGWDYLFGTLRVREDCASLRVGPDGYSEEDHSTLRGCLLTPFGPIKSRARNDPGAGPALLFG